MKIKATISRTVTEYREKIPFSCTKAAPAGLFLAIHKQPTTTAKDRFHAALFNDPLDVARAGYVEIAEIDLNDCISIENAIDEAEFYLTT